MANDRIQSPLLSRLGVVVVCLGACVARGQDIGPHPDGAPGVRSVEASEAARGSEMLPLGPGGASTPAPGAGGSGANGAGVASTFGALALVVGMAIGAAWLVRWLSGLRGGLSAQLGAGGRAPSGVLEVLGRYPVGRGQTLVLLKLDRRVLLLAQCAGGRRAGGGFSTLCEVRDPEEVASLLMQVRDGEQERLADQFTAALGRHARAHERTEAGTIPVVDLTGPRGGMTFGLSGGVRGLMGRLAGGGGGRRRVAGAVQR